MGIEPENAAADDELEIGDVKPLAIAGVLQRLVDGRDAPYHCPIAEKLARSAVTRRDGYAARKALAEEMPRAKYRMFCDLAKQRGRRYSGCTFKSFMEGCSIEQSQVAGPQVAKLRLLLTELPDRLLEGEANVVMLGPPGTGKDHLLMAMMRYTVLTHGYGVHWVDGMEFFASLKENKFRDQSELFDQCCSAQILAISDPVPPKGEIGNYDLTILRRIVERRYSRMMATWVTCNLMKPDEAREHFSCAVLDRLIDGATQVVCNWKSYRKLREQGDGAS